jgi:ATP-dependent helicase/nuclease subunit A
LTLGWQPEDGRTLFLVGDPMQSIYRFRQAEVGLFIKAQQQGLGTVQLTSLILQANFRSNANLVHWFNHTFSQIFPKVSDISLGAVNYQPSVAIREDSPNAFTLHPIYENSSVYSQAEKIVEIIQSAKQENPEQVIAILVKARTHLLEIIPALQQAQLPFHAVEIDALLARPLIQDLLSLTRALLHLADRVAWLSILRAPWCGLDLYDLHALAGTQHPEIIWKNLKNYAEIDKLSSDGKLRLSRIVPVLNAALNERRRISIRDWVEGTWIKLGGLCCIKDPSSLADKDAFFELLEEQQQGGDIRNLSAFSEKLTQLFANPDVNSDGKLQIMTIHKAKGLEFDTVIIPGLERTSSPDNLPLLAWLERTRLSQSSDLILAPIEACNDDKDKIYTYIKQQISEKSFFETVRLLYVAATRAKKSLHMLATLKIVPEKGILQKPRTRSFLHHLWPVVESNFQQLINLHSSRSQAIEEAQSDEHIHLPLNRLPVHGCHEHNFTTSPSVTEISFHNKKTTLYTLNETSKYIGIVAHRFLKHWIESHITILDAQKILNSTIIFETALKRLGTPLSQVDFATHQVKTALQNTLSDPKGQWLLGSHYLDSQCEYPLTQRIDDNVFQYIIDRTFVDEKNLRWIIDYKTSSPYNESLSDFLANQKKLYLDQLARYAKTFKSLESRPIKLGLYFPLCHGWIEWDG